MYANFTEETATGTGDVITLSGATSGNIPFSASFADGDLVAYVIEDGSGVKVSGIGTYSAGTITRNDSWNYNGSVVDKNPSTNIALTGDVVVRCSAANLSLIDSRALKPQTLASAFPIYDNVATVNRQQHRPYPNTNAGMIINLSTPVAFNHLVCYVSAESATDQVQIGIGALDSDGNPSELIEAVDVDVTTTGLKQVSLSKDYLLPAGRYTTVFANSDDTARFWSYSSVSGGGSYGGYNFRSGEGGFWKEGLGSAPNGVIPSTFGEASIGDFVRSIAVGVEYI